MMALDCKTVSVVGPEQNKFNSMKCELHDRPLLGVSTFLCRCAPVVAEYLIWHGLHSLVPTFLVS